MQGVKMKRLVFIIMMLAPASVGAQAHKKALDQMDADWGRAAITMLKEGGAHADALAEELKQIVLHGPKLDSHRARSVLVQGRATGTLIDIYEVLGSPMHPMAWGVLVSISFPDDVEAERFLQDMLNNSEPPKEACYDTHNLAQISGKERPLEEYCPLRTEWCFAGRLLYEDFGKGPDPHIMFPLCTGKTKEEEDSKWFDL
jgi:hypothetical protein